jgi:multiple sugar transport system substrate-binding protein
MWQNGGSMLNDAQDKAAFDSDESVEALEFITSLLRDDKVGPLEEMPGVGDLTPIAAGTQAMAHGGASTAGNAAEFAPDIVDQLDLFVPEEKTKAHLWYANTAHMTKGDQMDEAWMLLEHLLLDDDNGMKIHTALQDLPARQSLADSAPHMTPLVKKLIDEVMFAEGSRTTPIVEFAGEVIPRVDEAIAKALYGEATPREALAVAAEEANEIITRYLEEG